jgi:diguanylate cyclase (GGDEF) domain
MKIKNWLGIVVILIFLSAMLYSGLYTEEHSINTPDPVDGVLDLTNWSFESQGPVTLDGKWEFYFNEFLSSDDFQGSQKFKPTYIQIPSTFSSMNEVKPFASNNFYGTLRLVIKLPPNNLSYGLSSDIVLSSYKLYVNGMLYSEVGKVGTDKASSAPYYKLNQSYFDANSRTIELIYHTSDFNFGDNAITSPRLGLATQIANESKLSLSRDLFLFGMLLIMGIYHIGIFVMRTKDRTPLYFGIFCLMFALRMLIVGERFLPSLYEIDFKVYARASYITVYLGYASLCGFLYFSFKTLLNRWMLWISVGVSGLTAILTLFLPFPVIDQIIVYYVGIGFLILIYALIKLLIGLIKGVPYTGEVIVGFVCLLIGFANDYFYEINLTNTPSMIPFGLSIFVLTQAYMLSSKFSSAFSNTEKLSIENASILLDLKHINANLEAIVDSRTSDLKKALSDVELLSKTDYLTKLPNRRSIVADLEALIHDQIEFFIVIADIDHFKTFNDTYGHDMGDQLLIELSELLIKQVGEDGFVGRWGGEEFLLVIFGEESKEIFLKVDALREHLSSHQYHSIKDQVTLTFGLCKYTAANTLDQCIACADKALYDGKQNGRNQVRLRK